MTLQCSGTACTSINSIINNCFVSGVWAATSKTDWPQIGLETKGNYRATRYCSFYYYYYLDFHIEQFILYIIIGVLVTQKANLSKMLQVACSSLALVEFRHCVTLVCLVDKTSIHTVPTLAYFIVTSKGPLCPLVIGTAPCCHWNMGMGSRGRGPLVSCDIDMTKPGFSFVYFHHALIQKLEALVKENIGEWGGKNLQVAQ